VTRRVVGLDGCRDGWVAVELVDGTVVDVAVVPRAADVLDGSHDAAAVDIPIGLLDVAVRGADAAARAVLGRRSATVFSTPPRVVADLVAGDPAVPHVEATALAVATTGVGVSIQAFRLLPKVIEVDAIVAGGVDVLEVHPEVAFAHLVGEPLPRKTAWAGLEARRETLTAAGVVLPASFPGAERCAPDDVLDAAVCALTADLVASCGPVTTLPDPPSQFARGRPVVIHAPSPRCGPLRAR
jgi:predicted RNase H-like nuclease